MATQPITAALVAWKDDDLVLIRRGTCGAAAYLAKKADAGNVLAELRAAAYSDAAPVAELLGALRWLRAMWEPGSDHDTEEVKCALATADAALAKARGETL